ncbi:MAG TPA: TlpA disulfide reductase family protein [Steroidobacteraceae bacterium]|nr:TlpA disulfide reductase family protein [Steroidobacteraceae bacterium]
MVAAAVQNRWNSLFLLAAVLLGAAWTATAADPAYRLLGKTAPDFALRGTSGANFRLSEHRGDVVAVAFWGSRCGTCGAQLGTLSRLVDTYQSAGLAALAVNVDDDQSAAASFAVAHPVSFPVLLDPGKTVARQYRVDNLPMLLLIDRSGAIRYVHRNHRSGSDAQYLEQIRVLLDE